MQKWEYITTSDITNEQMNELGLMGWELVAVSVMGIHETFYFKRLIQ